MQPKHSPLCVFELHLNGRLRVLIELEECFANQAKEEGGNIVKYVDVLIPCGLHLDSTVTIVGKPIKNFYVQLMRDTSVVYKVEVVFDDYAAPFILQSQPYAVAKWEKLKTERCPASTRQWPASLTNTFGINHNS